MRRIALVCDWYLPNRGGIETHLAGLASQLVARGDEVHVITSIPGPSAMDGITVHRLDGPRVPWANVSARPVVRDVQRIVDRERIDLVHSHVAIVAPVGLGGPLAAHRSGVPSVVTFHSFVPATPIWAGLTGRLLGAADWRAVMTAVSGRVVREVRAFAPATEFVVLPNAVDTAFWTPSSSGLSKAPGSSTAPLTLTYVGRLQSKKRPQLLLRVASRLAAAGVRDFKIVVVGAGPLELNLLDSAATMGLEGAFEFRGWLPPTDVRELLRASDMFLSTATRESFGIAALEARAVGVPVVAMADSAVADFIEDGTSGLLAADDRAFADAALRLATDATLRRRIADHNAESVVPYDWDHTLRLHDAVYALADRRASGRDG